MPCRQQETLLPTPPPFFFLFLPFLSFSFLKKCFVVNLIFTLLIIVIGFPHLVTWVSILRNYYEKNACTLIYKWLIWAYCCLKTAINKEETKAKWKKKKNLLMNILHYLLWFNIQAWGVKPKSNWLPIKDHQPLCFFLRFTHSSKKNF